MYRKHSHKKFSDRFLVGVEFCGFFLVSVLWPWVCLKYILALFLLLHLWVHTYIIPTVSGRQGFLRIIYLFLFLQYFNNSLNPERKSFINMYHLGVSVANFLPILSSVVDTYVSFHQLQVNSSLVIPEWGSDHWALFSFLNFFIFSIILVCWCVFAFMSWSAIIIFFKCFFVFLWSSLRDFLHILWRSCLLNIFIVIWIFWRPWLILHLHFISLGLLKLNYQVLGKAYCLLVWLFMAVFLQWCTGMWSYGDWGDSRHWYLALVLFSGCTKLCPLLPSLNIWKRC